MSDLNLFRYYQRLAPLGIGSEVKTTLQDVSELLFTSPRHARSLLSQIQDQGWLSWLTIGVTMLKTMSGHSIFDQGLHSIMARPLMRILL